MLLPCLTALLLCSSVFSQAPAWNYNASSEEGPSHWGQFYPACYGASQSPINLVSAGVAQDVVYGELTFENYTVVPSYNFTLVNNGVEVQINMEDRIRTFNGEGLRGPYTLEQFHFHWSQENAHGSEHTVDDIGHAMEIHFVHYDASLYTSVSQASSVGDSQGVAVIGVFVDVNTTNANEALESISTHLHSIINYNESTTMAPFAVMDLFPVGKSYYRYQGSLTTPGCSESVVWTVMAQQIYISQTAIDEFRKIYDQYGELIESNDRPVQSINTRMMWIGAIPATTAKASTTSLSAFLFTLPLLLWALCRS